MNFQRKIEIYLEMKLQWLQQFYVAAKPRKPEKKTKEPKEEGWNENLEVELKSQHSEAYSKVPNQKPEERGEQEEFVSEANEEIALEEKEDQGTGRERLVVAEPVNCGEGDESEKIGATNQPDWLRHDADAKVQPDFKGRESFRSKIGKFVASDLHTRPPEPPEPPERGTVYEKEGDETKGKGDWELKEVDVASDQEPPPEVTPVEEMMPEGLLATATGGVATAMGGGVTVGEEVVKIAGRIEEGMEGRRDGREPPPEASDHAATVAEVRLTCEGGDSLLSLAAVLNDREWEEKEAWADWISWELGCWTKSMDQAQYLIITSPQLTNNSGVLQGKREMGQEKVGQTEENLKEVDCGFYLMGQAQFRLSKFDIF